jgi:hypothetical protein
MIKRQTFWTSAIILVTILGLVSFVGCGPSKEQQQMNSIVTEYGQAVDTYVELNGNGDTNALSEAKAKIEALQTQWMGIKSEMVGEVTPQVMQKLDKEFKTITKKYEEVPAGA